MRKVGLRFSPHSSHSSPSYFASHHRSLHLHLRRPRHHHHHARPSPFPSSSSSSPSLSPSPSLFLPRQPPQPNPADSRLQFSLHSLLHSRPPPPLHQTPSSC